MPHPLCEMLDILAGKAPHTCDNTCKYWRFEHLDRPCECSLVFSTLRGQPCYIYEPKGTKEGNDD